MAGTASFDDILGSLVTDEADRSTLSDLSVKYPGIKDGWLRQSDYSRKLDAFKPIEQEAQLYKGKTQEWENWAKTEWDFDKGRPKAELFHEARAKELEEQLAARGQDMTFDDITKAIKEQGLVSKTDLEATINSKAKEIDGALSGSAYFAVKVAELAGEHLHEFKKPLKASELVGKLQEYGTNDLDVAYNRYVADARKERGDKELEVKIAEIRKEERQKATDELLAKLPTGGLPVDQGDPGLGHLQAKMQHVGEADAADKAKLGDGTLAAIAAQEFRKSKLGTA